MGAVHPWAFKALEEAVLTLVVVWIVRTALGSCSFPILDRKLYFPLIGLFLLLSVVALQLLPLPVQIEKFISPGTYHLYQISLPGWPEKTPYSWLREGGISDGETTKAPPILRGQIGTQVPRRAAIEDWVAFDLDRSGTVLLPISVAPSLTKAALLKLLSYCLLGLLIVLYPFPDRNPRSANIYQALVRVLLPTGLLLGFVGLLQEFVSNGKPLWIFTPYTFKGQPVWGMRAFGPFANPDHYACFLAMLLPPALSGMVFPGVLGRIRERAAVPILSAVVAVVIIAAMLATASRGGMLNAIVGIAIFGLLSSRLPKEQLPDLFQKRKRKYLLLTVGILGLFTLAVYLAGSSHQAEADSRLKESFSNASIMGRLVPAEDSVRMIADFPLFGVGMGAWPDLYRRYARPPWSPVFMNAAHDEYIQLFAETGAAGFLLVAALLFALWRRANLRIFGLPRDQFAVIAALIASLAGLATQAGLDFPLRIPAIAVLTTIMIAFVVRALFQERTVPQRNLKLSISGILGAVGIIGVLLLVMWRIALQPKAPYPYDLETPRNSAEMRHLLLTHPANSRVHLILIGLSSMDMSQDDDLQELKRTVDLEPNNPVTRDMYLRALAQRGQNEAALNEMSESVLRAPSLVDHFYLAPDWVPGLTSAERGAIEKGLRAAESKGFDGANTALGDYYEEIGEFRKEAELFNDYALGERDSEQKAEFLSRSGRASAKAGDYERAIAMLGEAIRLSPGDSTAYEYLSLDVNVPRRQFERARLVLNQGIEANADPAKLYLKLAEVNRAAKDKNGEEAALKQAADLQPFNFEVIHTLGDLYLNDGRTDEAILWLRKATEVNPSSAEAMFELGQAEELAYQFSAAQDDYTKALALEPDNLAMKSRFQQFKERVAANSRSD